MIEPHCLLYAVADDFDANIIGTNGLANAPLDIVRTPMAAALISRHDPAAIQQLFDEAQASNVHLLACEFYACVNALSAGADILPVRFGTVLPTQSTIATLINRNAYSIHDGLERISGQQEWSIRLCYKCIETPAHASLDGRDFLRAKQQARADQAGRMQRLDDMTRHLIASLTHDKKMDVATQAIGAEDKACFFLARILALRGMTQTLCKTIESALAEFPDVSADVVGPEAPYHFGQLDMQRDAA
ncbi:MAG: GvpL/GvpF family gas vesicle protein [Pseudomonadota bacterium]